MTSPGKETLRPVLDELLADPVRLDAVVDRLVRRIRAEVPEYRTLPPSDLRAGNRSIVFAALGQLRAGRLPDRLELRDITAVGADRARRGMSLAAVLAAYRIGAQEFWDALAKMARDGGADDGTLLETVQLIYRWLDRVTVAAATAHREVELRSAREDEQRIGEALRALLTQPGAEEPSARALFQLGLDPAGRYAALHGRLNPGVGVSALRETVAAGGLLAAVGHRDVHQEVLGLLSVESTAPVELDPELGTFGVGPWCPAAELHSSYLTAGRALAAALRLGAPGAHSMQTLRLAGVAATDPAMTRILAERLLVPLEAKGEYGEDIWRTVRCYLRHGMRVDDTAAALHVHPNTLRHRLGHFADLTGADLRDPADLAEVWWLSVVPRS
ncbi:PucR family transcriptional regulator [Amycolatopsis nigrescens]|uniref:PucR family transcriptional regulator n=1 Tax=Amycolatopsis nigrescens TaxID=381445 RepID=UPI0003AABD61|nr:helix-turn-helix domain-containing protein [Amycolatopsis nigrescens]